MLIVNKQEYSKSDFELRLQVYEEMEQFQKAEGNRFALCLKDPFDIITLVFFLKEKKSSVLLIHEDTPKETAIEMAKRANCVGILYGEYGDFTKLEVGNFY